MSSQPTLRLHGSQTSMNSGLKGPGGWWVMGSYFTPWYLRGVRGQFFLDYSIHSTFDDVGNVLNVFIFYQAKEDSEPLKTCK